MNSQNDVVPASKKKEKGATLVEYALLVALIAVIAIVAMTFLGRSVSTQFSNVGTQVG